MNKFKVGDRVKILGGDGDGWGERGKTDIGKYGTVVHVISAFRCAILIPDSINPILKCRGINYTWSLSIKEIKKVDTQLLFDFAIE